MPAALADINSADAPAPAVAPLPLAIFAAAITVNVYERGYDPESNSTEGFAAALAVAASADVVVFVGRKRICEGGQGQSGAHCKSEGYGRPLRSANATHASDLRVQQECVLAALAGGPISMNWESDGYQNTIPP